jgi:predicted nucleic acid-binding Zn ribbon protein
MTDDAGKVAGSPWRNDGVTTTRTCPICGRSFEPSGRRRHCSDPCRQAAWRRRHAAQVPEPPVPPKGRRREMTVYACDGCGAREVGVQRCEDCNSWMRAVGVGGHCPCCGDAVAITELLEGGA